MIVFEAASDAIKDAGEGDILVRTRLGVQLAPLVGVLNRLAADRANAEQREPDPAYSSYEAYTLRDRLAAVASRAPDVRVAMPLTYEEAGILLAALWIRIDTMSAPDFPSRADAERDTIDVAYADLPTVQAAAGQLEALLAVPPGPRFAPPNQG